MNWMTDLRVASLVGLCELRYSSTELNFGDVMGFNDCAGGIIFSSRMWVDFKIRRVAWFFPVSNGEKMSFKVVAIRLVSPGVLFEKINRNLFLENCFSNDPGA